MRGDVQYQLFSLATGPAEEFSSGPAAAKML
jgi:hypothetical protein